MALIQQIDPVYVNSTQAVAEVARLRKAATATAADLSAVRIVLEDGSELPQRGRLLFSDLSVDPTSAQVTLRTEVANPQALLLPGMYVRTRLVQGQIAGAMLVPQQAVTRGPQGDSVLVVGEGGKAAPRNIKIGGASGSNWIVLDGLKAGEQVIVEGFQKMRPGAPVKPVPWTGAAPARPARSGRRQRPRLGRQPLRGRTPWLASSSTGPSSRGSSRCSSSSAAPCPSRSCRWRSTRRWRRRPSSSPWSIRARRPRRWKTTCSRVIEQEMNGSPGLIYMESVAQANGSGTLTLTFSPNTNPDLAQVDVQNRLSRATPRLPSAVTQQGVRVDKSRSNFLLFTILTSTDPAYDPVALGDYASRNVLPEIQRIPGVGQAQLFGTERAMRIWIDPAKLVGYGMSVADVNGAIRAQNAQVSSGTLGDLPNLADQTIFATIVVDGQLSNVEQFGNIVLRANADGSSVRMRDVARIELGAQTYATSARLNGQPSTGIGVQLSPTGNALQTAKAVRERMAELQQLLPAGHELRHPLRHLALRADLHRQGGGDAARGGGAGVPGDVPVPAELALHHHPDHRRAGGAARHLHGAADAGLFDQRAHHVRHGAGGGHRGRRCHRRGRERRAHHERGGPAAACRPRARRWGRSPAPSSASPWC